MNRFDELFMQRAQSGGVELGPEQVLGIIENKCESIITRESLRGLMSSQRPLRVKFGIDPTATELHLGHVVPIMLLKLFARLGHSIDLVIGDFTASIGDPSGRTSGRLPLSRETIIANMANYKQQIGRILDMSAVKVRYNSEWLGELSLRRTFSIFQGINLAEAIQRDDFRSRMKAGHGVSLAEVSYGVLMGLDSVELQTNIELGGIDQLLNFQQCRKVMRQQGLTEEVILMTPILEGIAGDGRKMSKSYGNSIPIMADPSEIFGKLMSMPDRLISPYLRAFADITSDEITELNQLIVTEPLEAKKQMATLVVSVVSGDFSEGTRQRANFERLFSSMEIEEQDCITLKAEQEETVFQVLCREAPFTSRSGLRRLFEQRAVRHISAGEETVITADTSAGAITGILRVGRRHHFRLSCGS